MNLQFFLDFAGLSRFLSHIQKLLNDKAESDHTHDYNSLDNTPSIPEIKIVTWSENDMA